MILKKRKKLYILLLVLIICFLNYNINTGTNTIAQRRMLHQISYSEDINQVSKV